MTMLTYYFNRCKANGQAKKAGTAWFRDGMKHMERTLWYNESDSKYYVVLNGNAHEFTAYDRQNVNGVIKGHI